MNAGMVQGGGCQVFVGSRVVIDLVLNAGLSAFATVLNGLPLGASRSLTAEILVGRQRGFS